MNIAGIDYESVNDGESMRTVIYVSGCSHGCHNCHNPETQDENYGVPFTETLQNEIIKNITKRPFLSGLTWSGGDPLNENCLNDVLKFTDKIRLSLPEKTIWLYTGYTWEQIMKYELRKKYVSCDGGMWNCDMLRQIVVSRCDVLIDGRYEDKLRDVTLKWRGSANQRIIDVKQSLANDKVVLYDV